MLKEEHQFIVISECERVGLMNKDLTLWVTSSLSLKEPPQEVFHYFFIKTNHFISKLTAMIGVELGNYMEKSAIHHLIKLVYSLGSGLHWSAAHWTGLP